MISQQHMLCGDEVKAVVADIGSGYSKFGAAGQELPRHVIRSEIGSPAGDWSDPDRLVFGDSGFRFCKEDLEVSGLRRDLDYDWDHFQRLLRHGVTSCMRVRAEEYPVMLACSATAHGDKRKLMEICLEAEAFPAMYAASASSLSAFSAGRRSGLVVDLGAAGTNVAAVVDGYEIARSRIHTDRGGDALDRLLRREVAGAAPTVIRPWFEAARAAGATPFAPSSSFRELHVAEVARDLKQWMCFVPHSAIAPGEREAFYAHRYKLPPPYELPDGALVHASDALCTLPERLFFGSKAAAGAGSDEYCLSTSTLRKRCRAVAELEPALDYSQGVDAETDSLSTLVYASVARCDVDVRKELLANVMLVGGGALLDGVAQRIANELADVVPSHMKVRTASAALPAERRNAAWIGGSVLSICGSFQQLWLSRSEYEEQGPLRAGARFDH